MEKNVKNVEKSRKNVKNIKKFQKCRKTGLKPFKISIKRQKRREIGKKSQKY